MYLTHSNMQRATQAGIDAHNASLRLREELLSACSLAATREELVARVSILCRDSDNSTPVASLVILQKVIDFYLEKGDKLTRDAERQKLWRQRKAMGGSKKYEPRKIDARSAHKTARDNSPFQLNEHDIEQQEYLRNMFEDDAVSNGENAKFLHQIEKVAPQGLSEKMTQEDIEKLGPSALDF